jgi:hypothetical protein
MRIWEGTVETWSSDGGASGSVKGVGMVSGLYRIGSGYLVKVDLGRLADLEVVDEKERW